MENQKPIGIFDSGLGGLSICRELKKALPNENIHYFADLQFSPYGTKSEALIAERCEFIVNHFVRQECKLAVVACNTATVSAIAELRTKFSIPIVGVEPGIKPACERTKSGKIGVLATEQTLKSQSFNYLKSKFVHSTEIHSQACPDFVRLVESRAHNSQEATEVATAYISPLLESGCDQIVLGCTHFSFLTSAIRKVVQNRAAIVDTAIPVVQQIESQLKSHQLINTGSEFGSVRLWTSGSSEEVSDSMLSFWPWAEVEGQLQVTSV